MSQWGPTARFPTGHWKGLDVGGSQWEGIGESEGGARGVRPWSNFFYFHAVFAPNSGVGALVWEILDPPLEQVNEFEQVQPPIYGHLVFVKYWQQGMAIEKNNIGTVFVR